MNTISRFIQVKPIEKIREYAQEKTGLFGLLKWEVIAKQERFGEELRIFVERLPEEIYVNGEKYIKK